MNSFATYLVLLVVAAMHCQQTLSAPKDLMALSKVFNYQGIMPIRDERTGELNKTDTSTVNPNADAELAEAEAACWRLINEQSVVTFALQRKVLDELDVEMKSLKMDDALRASVDKITTSMRANMNEATEALKKDAADEFFDALFDASEDIIRLSSILREPQLDENTFLTLVKAVSRLGRNNAALIQEFTDMCSFVQRSPRPRVIGSAL